MTDDNGDTIVLRYSLPRTPATGHESTFSTGGAFQQASAHMGVAAPEILEEQWNRSQSRTLKVRPTPKSAMAPSSSGDNFEQQRLVTPALPTQPQFDDGIVPAHTMQPAHAMEGRRPTHMGRNGSGGLIAPGTLDPNAKCHPGHMENHGNQRNMTAQDARETHGRTLRPKRRPKPQPAASETGGISFSKLSFAAPTGMGPPKNAEPAKRYGRGPMNTTPTPYDHQTPGIKRSQRTVTESELPLPEAKVAVGARKVRHERPPALLPKDSPALESELVRPSRHVPRPAWDKPYLAKDRYPVQDQECDYTANAGTTGDAGVNGQHMRQAMVAAGGAPRHAQQMANAQQQYMMMGTSAVGMESAIGQFGTGTEMFTKDNLNNPAFASKDMPMGGGFMGHDRPPEMTPIVEPQQTNRSQRATGNMVGGDPWIQRQMDNEREANAQQHQQQVGMADNANNRGSANMQMGSQQNSFANMYNQADPNYIQEGPRVQQQQPSHDPRQRMAMQGQMAHNPNVQQQQMAGPNMQMAVGGAMHGGRPMDSIGYQDQQAMGPQMNPNAVMGSNNPHGSNIVHQNRDDSMAHAPHMQGGATNAVGTQQRHVMSNAPDGVQHASAPVAYGNGGAIAQHNQQMLHGNQMSNSDTALAQGTTQSMPMGAGAANAAVAAEFMNVQQDDVARASNPAGNMSQMQQLPTGAADSGMHSQRADGMHNMPNATAGQIRIANQQPIYDPRVAGQMEQGTRMPTHQGSSHAQIPVMPAMERQQHQQMFEQRAAQRNNAMAQDAPHMPPADERSIQLTQVVSGHSSRDSLGVQELPMRNDGGMVPQVNESKVSMRATIKEMFSDEFGDDAFSMAPKATFQQQMSRASRQEPMPEHR